MWNHYGFWLIVVSLGVLVLERLRPWRKGQPLIRPQLGQDIFWLVFNGYSWGLFVAFLFSSVPTGSGVPLSVTLNRFSGAFTFMSSTPLWVQVCVYLVLADFLEWCVHNLLHRVGWMWKIHRVHHSIHVMDWIGNFRFHWGELIIYKTLKYLPMTLLGARWDAILVVAVISTTIGNLNHANLNISWGPLRYILNSPRMHIWHHDRSPDRPAGYNFGVVLSVWDWIFGTAFMPMDRVPNRIGFRYDEQVSENLLMRFFVPFVDRPYAHQDPSR